MFTPKANERRREFQKGLDEEESRRRRQERSHCLRRQERSAKLQQKRQRVLTQSQRATNSDENNESNKSNHPEFTVQDIPRLTQGIFCEDRATHFECVRGFRKLLSIPQDPPIQQVIDTGAIPRVLSFCRDSKYPQLQYEALWVLTNVASGPAEYVSAVIKHGSDMVFIDLVHSPLYEVQNMALWAVGNIAGESKELRDKMMKNHILEAIHKVISHPFDAKSVTNFSEIPKVTATRHPKHRYIEVINITSWVLGNLCRGGVHEDKQDIIRLVDTLLCLLAHYEQFAANDMGRCPETDEQIEELIRNVAWAVSYLLNYESIQEELIDLLGSKGIIQKFIAMADDKEFLLRRPIQKVLGTILQGTDEHTAKCLKMGILTKYKNVLNIGQSHRGWWMEARDICWSLSNICAGTRRDKEQMMESGLFPKVIHLLKEGPYSVGKEALWTLCNVTDDCDKRMIGPLMNMGMMDAVCHFVTKHQNTMIHHKAMEVVLECIGNVLIVGEEHLCEGERNPYADQFEECGGLDWLEEIQGNEDVEDDVYDRCVEIIKRHFELDDEGMSVGALDYGLGAIENGKEEDGTFSFGVKDDADSGPFLF